MKLPLVPRPRIPSIIKAALLAGHAQHPVIIHFPIALFIASAVFDVTGGLAQSNRFWQRSPTYNLRRAPR